MNIFITQRKTLSFLDFGQSSCANTHNFEDILLMWGEIWKLKIMNNEHDFAHQLVNTSLPDDIALDTR